MAISPSSRISSPARATLAVGSGKGGVGKSTISLNLALALAETGAKVGLCDADVYGPDIPRMVNVARKKRTRSWDLWRSEDAGGMRLPPVEIYGLKIMSTGFLMGEDQSLEMGAELIDLIVRQFLEDVDWGELDFLVFDLPPGTADLQRHLMRRVSFTGALLVVTPQDVAHLDARKAVSMYRGAGVKVIGAIENMSWLKCPHCDERVQLFPIVTPERAIWSMGVDKLGELPMDLAMAQAGDAGRPLLIADPDSQQSHTFRQIATRVADLL